VSTTLSEWVIVIITYQHYYLQGRLGNCYYLAAIAGCATGGNDVLLKDVCIENYGNVGLYGVKFFINGKWATVIVDDRIPCENVGSGWKPIFASPMVHSVCVKVCVCLLVCISARVYVSGHSVRIPKFYFHVLGAFRAKKRREGALAYDF
jgi:hypothetical protein